MATSSYPFPEQDTSEDQFTALFRELQDSGVAGSADGTNLRVTGDSTGMHVSVQPGFAIARGFAFSSTAVEVLTIAAASGSARVDRVVLRLDPTANSVVLAVITGTPGSGAPALTRTDTGIYEVPLALVNVATSTVTIAASNVVEDRHFTGTRICAWEGNDQRPTTPRQSQLGYNRATSSFEFWNGTAWTGLVVIPDGPKGELAYAETATLAWADNATPVLVVATSNFVLTSDRKLRITWGTQNAQGTSGAETGRLQLHTGNIAGAGTIVRRGQWHNPEAGGPGEVSPTFVHRVSVAAGTYRYGVDVLRVSGGTRTNVTGTFILVEDMGPA